MLIKLLVLLVTLQSIVGQHEDSFGCGGFVKSGLNEIFHIPEKISIYFIFRLK